MIKAAGYLFLLLAVASVFKNWGSMDTMFLAVVSFYLLVIKKS